MAHLLIFRSFAKKYGFLPQKTTAPTKTTVNKTQFEVFAIIFFEHSEHSILQICLA